MSRAERWACTSAPWRWFAGGVVLPWVVGDAPLQGDVLEIGGGAGAMAAVVAERHPDARITVTDLDPKMVAAASDRLAPFEDRATARVADATRLPFEDESFDLVLTFLMLHHVVGWEPAIAEAARVLRPGGRIIGMDLVSTRLTTTFHRSHAGLIAMATPDQLADALSEAGLRSITVRPAFAGSVVRLHATR